MTADVLVHLSAAGVSLLLDCREGRLPAIVHWGAALGDLGADDARALVLARGQAVANDTVDVPVRLSVLPAQHTGWTGRPGISGARSGVGWSPRFEMGTATLDGAPVSGYVVAGAGCLVLDGADDELRLALSLTVELLPTGLLRTRAELTNGPDAGAPYQVDDVVIAYPVPAEASELLDFTGRWGHERQPQRSTFQVGLHLREGRHGRTGSDAAYLLHAGTPGFGFAAGQVYAVHPAWSGNHTTYAEHTSTGERVLGAGELLLPGEVVLDPGASYRTPWVYGSYGVGLDEVAARFHRHLRDRDRPVSVDRPVTLNVWEAVYFDHDLDRLLALAERAAQVGVERFVLDDGWFGGRRHDRAGLGDWVVSPEVYPDGLYPLVDRVKGLGMQFGLWFEPEMVNVDSDVARAHPEWVMAARRDLPVEARFQQVLNIGHPQAYAHVRDQMVAVLGEYPVDYVKWDHNRDLVEAGDQTRGGRPAVHEQTLAYYRLLDEIRALFPHLEVESCAAGGSRVDLEVLMRAERVWVSDDIDPLERQTMLAWTGQLIPPEFMGSHIAADHSHQTGRAHDLSFRAGTAVFGHLGIEWDLTQASAADLAELSAWVAFYKQRRGLLLGGTVVRMDGFDPAVVAKGVVAADRGEAVYSVAAVAMPSASPGPRLRLRGLDPARRYALRPLLVAGPPRGLLPPPWWGEGPSYPGITLTGAALEHAGVAAPILWPEQVVLYHALSQDDDRVG